MLTLIRKLLFENDKECKQFMVTKMHVTTDAGHFNLFNH